MSPQFVTNAEHLLQQRENEVDSCQNNRSGQGHNRNQKLVRFWTMNKICVLIIANKLINDNGGDNIQPLTPL